MRRTETEIKTENLRRAEEEINLAASIRRRIEQESRRSPDRALIILAERAAARAEVYRTRAAMPHPPCEWGCHVCSVETETVQVRGEQ